MDVTLPVGVPGGAGFGGAGAFPGSGGSLSKHCTIVSHACSNFINSFIALTTA